MRRILMVGIAALASMFATGSVFAQALVADTPHNLTTVPTIATDDGRICVYCHTPHNSNSGTGAAGEVEAPLWHRDATATVFQMYDSPTIDMTIAAQPQGVSLACLGCHDGSIALDSLFNDYLGTGGTGPTITGSALVGADMRNDHPVSVTYDPLADPDFVADAGGLPLFGAGADQMECGSCHSVHNNSITPFLQVANTGSALCLTCHVK